VLILQRGPEQRIAVEARVDNETVSVQLLIGYDAIDEQRAHGVAFVLDLTERKRSEQERDKLRSDLAYMSRVTTMGELAASFAHEIKQPIAAAMLDAQALSAVAAARDTQHRRGL
jgi:C4-dicarboxylate-specific signal transduction histidine kinase